MAIWRWLTGSAPGLALSNGTSIDPIGILFPGVQSKYKVILKLLLLLLLNNNSNYEFCTS
jgi:hypothetical protein